MAPDDLLYEYAVVRCVPRVDREEFVNIGLIMMNKRKKWLKGMVIPDEVKLRALYPEIDIECVKKQSRLFELKEVPKKDLPVEEKYRWLAAVKSGCLQVSPSHPGILYPNSENYDAEKLMEEEFERIFHEMVV